MESQSTTPARKDRILRRREIEGLIADGATVFILEGKVMRVDCWLEFHPGGDKAIRHMVGRDATDEVSALHSPEAREKMHRYQIGRIEGPWVNFVPPIQGGTFTTYNPEEGDAESEIESDSLSEGSPAPSEIFDYAGETSGLRRRNSFTSTSSASSSPPPQPKSDPTDLDRKTQLDIEVDLAKYPCLSAESQRNIVEKYRALNARIRAAGLYNCNYYAYLIEVSRYTLLFSLSLFALHHGWYCTAGVFLGCFWHQLVFAAHDAGHMGITHDFVIDTTIGIIIADFIGGLSLGWWKRSHNVHHIVTNAPEHDPDIELMPFFAVSHRFFTDLYSTYYNRIMEYDAVSRLVVRYQHLLYYPVLTLGRFNLYLLSWEYLFLGQGPRKGAAWWHRWFEIAGQLFFWAWFGYGILYCSIPDWYNRVAFVLISHMVTAPLHVQITLSHYGMSTSDMGPGESFPQKMLRTTMDVDCPEWLDFFHGGLQFQAIHHLYPRIPRHNLRKTQAFVKEFCEEVDIPYTIYTFYDGNKEVISHLRDVANQAQMLKDMTKARAEQGVFSDHH
ncbi:hypothetical protein FQN54_005179 [Arachnomyces sp. PD_36]|nr:hypothetical protein FQN54_005179 [Arachnomyces sp. PD_36]